MKHKSYLMFVLAVILSIPLMALFSGYWSSPVQDADNQRILFEKATVKQVVEEVLSPDPEVENLKTGYQQIEIRIETGPYKGESFFIKNGISRLYNVIAKPDSKLIVRVIEDQGQLSSVNVFNYDRGGLILGLVALFAALLIYFGRKKGALSLLALVFTGATVIFVLVPLLLKGFEPMITSIGLMSVVTVVCFLLVSQWQPKTLAAIIGTIGGIAAAGFIAYITGQMGHLSGMTMSEAEEMLYLAGDRGLKVHGLMFAAILIASLGAVMDVAMSIASSVFEIHAVSGQKQKPAELFKSGMNVGRDVMGTMADTLILAFAGGSLNIIILIAAFRMPYLQILNLDLIGTEIILSLSGSIGIILSVPLTALAAALIAGRKYNAVK